LLVYWGIELVSPRFLALTAFLSTALMSTVTGTSWGAAGTIGVALMGTAAALDAPLGLTAGAVVSGAYFGHGAAARRVLAHRRGAADPHQRDHQLGRPLAGLA
jgi:hypothetical protein